MLSLICVVMFTYIPLSQKTKHKKTQQPSIAYIFINDVLQMPDMTLHFECVVELR